MIKIDGSHGINLKRIYYTIFNVTENINTMFDNTNANVGTQRKIESFHTEMDGRRRQEFNLDVTKNEDYYYLKPMLQNTMISNVDLYLNNSVWIDHWDNFEQLDNVEQGIPLDRQYSYQYKGTTTVNTGVDRIHTIFIVAQRKMMIANGLILLDNSL
jgi:hypothetical protein